MQAAVYHRPSWHSLWSICRLRLLSLPRIPGRSRVEGLLADGFSTAMAAILALHPLALLEHASRIAKDPADAFEEVWGHVPDGKAASQLIQRLATGMQMLVDGNSAAAVAAKASKVSSQAGTGHAPFARVSCRVITRNAGLYVLPARM